MWGKIGIRPSHNRLYSYDSIGDISQQLLEWEKGTEKELLTYIHDYNIQKKKGKKDLDLNFRSYGDYRNSPMFSELP